MENSKSIIENQEIILNPSKGEKGEKGNLSKGEKEILLDKGNQSKSIEKSSNNDFKSDLYSFNPSKKERTILRGKRDRLIIRILKSNEDKDLKKRNEIIKEFKDFYSKNYLINDYSINSLSRNSNESSKEFLNDFLNQIKKWKIKN